MHQGAGDPDSENPSSEHLNPKLQRWAIPLMSFVVLVTMLGAAWPVLFHDGSALAKNLEKRVWVDAVDDQAVAATMEAELYGEEPPVAEISTHDPRPRIEFVRKADKTSAILCILIAAALPFLIRWRRQAAWLCLLPALWLLLNASAVAMNGGKAYAELAIPAHATRWMLPVALALFVLMADRNKPTANWLLRIACASTFAIHGWEAFQLHPGFQDLIFIASGQLGLELSTEVCHVLLRGIGILDGLLALSVLLIHSPRTLYWMTFWGLITAFSRPLTMGWDAWPELAIRLANGAVPLLIIGIGLPALIRLNRDERSSNLEPVSQDP